jgi:hypothetical protein
MPHVLARVTIAEIRVDQNVCKIVYENNLNLLNVAFAGASRAEAEKSRLQTVRQVQALEAANVCNLTAAQNAKRDLDECKDGAERAEEDAKNLKNEARVQGCSRRRMVPNFRIFRAQDTSCNL